MRSIATVTKVMAEMVDTLRDEASALSGGAAAQLTQRHAERTRPVSVRPLASLAAAEPAGTDDGSVAPWARRHRR